MDKKEFYDFINKADAKLKQKYGFVDAEKEAYARLAKISEEMGELSAEVLKQYGKQDDKKLLNVTKEKLENEFADVIITVSLLAKTMNVDIDVALEHKIMKIKKKLDI